MGKLSWRSSVRERAHLEGLVMYPSGLWQGFWQQEVWGRQPMYDLELSFTDGRIEGQGEDIIGCFTFRGSYDAQGSVMLIKQYQGRHSVLYQGHYDGEGSIFGQWLIPPHFQGSFALAPVRRPTSGSSLPISDIF